MIYGTLVNDDGSEESVAVASAAAGTWTDSARRQPG